MSELPLVDLGIRLLGSSSSRKDNCGSAHECVGSGAAKALRFILAPAGARNSGLRPPRGTRSSSLARPLRRRRQPRPQTWGNPQRATQTTRVILNAAASPPKGRAAQRDRVHALSAQPGQNILRRHTHTQ
jgi:hypothetical protein